ncbi:aminopeptidase [Fusibacter paucivorans]|uniref:Aminopeptidase n=1 Tax=Fusibacter paucivorans TaxID=76009 RepID=A0ABS5PP56_9FIRM|nr:aminopeptidase [Fusibacter paucivorans]MBS7526131.1 aminopeptidase [Fusibacter paucivorans]
MFQERLKKYAELLIKTGVNLKSGQLLVIKSPIECAPFVHEVMTAAFAAGAGDVEIFWNDEIASKIKYMMAPDELFDTLPSWQREFYLSAAAKGAAFLSVAASDPELMKEVDPSRMVRFQKAYGAALKSYRQQMMNNELVWCVASAPTKAWAKKVYPDKTEVEAVEALWEAIFKTVRIDAKDPIAAWEAHKEALASRMNKLNAHQFTSLHYRNSLGTDLTIGLPKGHLWLGGADKSSEGHEFVANIPTEEIFTAPQYDAVEGIVYSALPLNLNGNLIEDFSLTFEKGKIVEFTAKKGYDQLKSLVETDEGSAFLGEVALVPHDSPISNMNLLFFNTLFDENAACHLAIGKAYPVCLENGDKMSMEELKAHGINDSIVHEDFMIGTADLQIVGITADGSEVTVFKDGNFAF